MQNQEVNYCGDKEMRLLLDKAGAKLRLSEVYGLIYGGLAAPHPVLPMDYLEVIFGKEREAHLADQEVKKVFDNMQALWNIFTQWNPETDPIALPDLGYTDNYEGIVERLRDNSSLIEFFIKGLDMGHAAENDFGEGGIAALKQLSEINALMHQYADTIENEKLKDGKPEKETEQVNQMEELSAQYISTMTNSLKEARMLVKRQMDMMSDDTMKDKKVPRNDPCPCGSGKKYKNCCGAVH